MSLLERLASSAPLNVLTDGRLSVSYADLPDAVARFERLADAALGPRPTGTLMLAGRNNLGTMIAALSCMVSGRSLYLWRPSSDGPESPFSWSDLPEFCTSTVAARCDDAETSSTIEYEFVARPASNLTVLPCETPYIYLGTSGTTARPKLAAYTRERLLGNAENCVRRFQITAHDRVLLPLPLAHMYGFGAAFLPAVLAGAAFRLIAQVNLLSYQQAEREFDPTVVFLTPALAHQLITVRKEGRPYRLTVMGADRIDPASFARYEDRHGCTVCVYGSTELGAIASGSPDDPFERRQRSSGNLLDQVRLVPHPDAGDENERTLCFAHPFGMVGYANERGEPELPADLFQDGAYLTSDVGELDMHGDLLVRGRKDDCVKRNGYLVAFADVERALEQLPGVSRAIVMGGEATPRGIALIAFCVMPKTEGDVPQLRQACHAVLPDHAVPDQIVILDHLPLLSTGKPDRRALHSLLIAKTC